jgi:hypothetical protein
MKPGGKDLPPGFPFDERQGIVMNVKRSKYCAPGLERMIFPARFLSGCPN